MVMKDEQMKGVSPSLRRLAICSLVGVHLRLQLPQIVIGSLLGQSRGSVERLHRHGHVQAEQLRLLPPVEVQRELVSSTENSGKENAAPVATTPPEVVLDTPKLL